MIAEVKLIFMSMKIKITLNHREGLLSKLQGLPSKTNYIKAILGNIPKIELVKIDYINMLK